MTWLPCSAKILYSQIPPKETSCDYSGFPGISFCSTFYASNQNVFFRSEIAHCIAGKGQLTTVHLDKKPTLFDAIALHATFIPRIVEINPTLFIVFFTLNSSVNSAINNAKLEATLWESFFVIEKDANFDVDMQTAIKQSLNAVLPSFLEQNTANKNLLFYISGFTD